MNSRYVALAALALVATLAQPDDAPASEVTGKTLQADFLVMTEFGPIHFKNINVFFGKDQAYDYSNSHSDKGTIRPINKKYTTRSGSSAFDTVKNNIVQWKKRICGFKCGRSPVLNWSC